MADEVHLLSNEDLRSKLRHFNLPDGPITRTTRKMFEKKLQRALKIEAGIIELDSSAENPIVNHTGTPNKANIHTHDIDISSIKTSSELIIKRETVDQNKKPASTFYGVCLHCEGKTEPKTPLVFTDKSEALFSAKKNSGARFKAFNNRNEAEAFAFGNQVTPSRQISPIAAPVDPIGKFKAPKPGEIVQFRKLIEIGNVDRLSELMYENPKYLISSGDTPVVLQEGFRYNAMHVAAKAGRNNVCKLTVNTLEDNVFWNLIYPNSNSLRDQDVGRIRKRFVLDLYLNAPDKGLGETPLHFACKYGQADVVDYLLSYPGIDKFPKNKYGDTPEQVICSRMSNCPDELRSRIKKMFTKEETMFVPILRSEDNCSYPKLGEPSPDLIKPRFMVEDSPEDPHYKISAYAGPMSPQEAEKFCSSLKSPRATPEEQVKFRNIRRSDSEKGLERVARKVAKSRNVGWCEYWKFLDIFTDLSTKDGLIMLEEYLGNNKTLHDSQKTPNTSRHDISYSGSDSVFEEKMKSPISNHEQHTPAGRDPNLKNFRNRLSWDEERSKNNDEELLSDKLNLSKDINSDITCCLSDEKDKDVCREGLINHDVIDEESELPSSRKLNFDDDTLDVSNYSEDSLQGLATEFEQLRLSSETFCEKEENKLTCVPVTYSEPCNIRSDTLLFIEGFEPSKIDLDVLRAIKSVKIDPNVYPNITRWQKMVRSFPKSARQIWPGPGSPRFVQSRKRISKTWSC